MTTPTPTFTDQDAINAELDRSVKQYSKTVDKFSETMNVTTGMMGSSAIMAKELATSGVDFFSGLQKEYANIYNYADELAKAIGGINVDMMAGRKEMSLWGKVYIEGFEDAAQSVLFAEKAVENFGDNAEERFGVANPLLVQFGGDAVEAGKAMNSLNASIGENIDAISLKMDKKTKNNLLSIQKSMRLSNEDLRDLMESQYVYTGEASTKMIEEIANVSVALANKTGIQQQVLQKGIIDIRKDFQRFGDIGVDAAGRIAAKVRALGLDIETVNKMTDQFLNFDSAADKMGELSALFGIQLDAMEMTYLANEDREEFLTRMRDEILDSGVDIDNMSQARARALSDQLGMNIKQMKTFLKEGNEAFDEADLAAATSEDVMNADGIATAYKDIGTYTQQQVLDSKQIAENMRLQGLFTKEARENSYGLMDNLQKAQAELGKIEIPKQNRDKIAQQIGNLGDQMEAAIGKVETTVTFVNAAGGDLSKLASGDFSIWEILTGAGVKQEDAKVVISGEENQKSGYLKSGSKKDATLATLSIAGNGQSRMVDSEITKAVQDLQNVLTLSSDIEKRAGDELRELLQKTTQAFDKILTEKTASGDIKVTLQLDGKDVSQAVIKANGGGDGDAITLMDGRQ